MAKAPKTLKQQYNSLRRKAEKMLALPENTGRGLKLPKVPKRITRKSVARMEDFNESIRQPNYMRKLRRQERAKEALANWRENLKQNPEAYAEFIRKRSEASKKYWADLKQNRPEEFASRIRKMQEGAAEYRRKVKEGIIQPTRYKNKLTETDVVGGTSSRSEAMKKYWEDLKTNNPEKYEERIRRLRESRISRQHEERVNEIIKEAEDELKQEVGDIQLPIDKLESISPKQPHEMTDEELTALMKEVSGGKVSQMPEVDENLIKDFEEVAKNLQKEPSIFDEWKDELGDIYEEVPTGYFDETYGAYDMGDKFEVSPFESIMVDKVYRQNFGDKLNYFSEIHAGSMAKYFISILSHELDNKNEVNYIIAKSIENGDLEIGWSRMYDTAKETASKLISALNKWIYREDPEFIVRHLSFNKQEFIDTINQIANDLDEGAEEWQIESRYDTGGIL